MKLIRLLLLFLCFSPLAMYAQNTSVGGVVQDPSGAVVPKASVELRNQDTGIRRQTTTNREGYYHVEGIDPGKYDATVQASSFKTLTRENMIFHVGDEGHIDFKLQLGESAQHVDVDGSGLQINTTDASVSTVIDRKFVENIPLNGRSFQDLIALTPGVVTQSPQASTQVGTNGDFSVNGQRAESNYYIVDGVSANINSGNGLAQASPAQTGGVPSSTALGTTQTLVSVDALQEFRVESSTYSAEYGRSPGGQFSFNTRSGTDNFHGTAFEYLRNDFFDANNWFNDYYGEPINALRQNDFGGTLGGPVKLPFLHQGENKTFFFFSYEGLRLDQPQAATIVYVPDMFLRQQAAPSVRGILNAFPVQNGLDYGNAANPNLAQFIQSYSAPSNINSTSIRIDQTATSKVKLFFRYSDTPSYTSYRNGASVNNINVAAQSYTLGVTTQISPRVVSDIRFGYAKSITSDISHQDSFGGATPVDLAAVLGASGYSRPELGYLLLVGGIGTASITSLDSANKSWQWNLTDSTNISLGHHQLKFGIDYRKIVSPTIPSDVFIGADFFSPQAALTDVPDELAVEKQTRTSPQLYQTSVYVQDEWRVSSRLSASGGLRWEVNPPPTGSDGKDAYTIRGNIANPSSIALAPLGTPLWKTSWFNIAPRLGLAWIARTTPGWETVIRTGGGVFFDSSGATAVIGFGGIGYRAEQVFSDVALPVPPADLAFTPSAAPPYTNSGVIAFPTHLQLPYTLQWNTSLEQALGKPQTLTVSYVGSNGRRLMYEQLLLGVGGFADIGYYPAGLTSNYQSLQVKLQRSVAHGVQALASYTWSHSIDFGSTNDEFSPMRGNSDFDVRHNFQSGLSWDLPHASANRLVSSVIDGWGIDGRLIARSSFPITLLGNFNINPGTGQAVYSSLNYNPAVPLYLRGCGPGPACFPGGRAVNPAAFTLPASGVVGDAPRNFVRGFDANQVNLAARRDFRLYEGMTLQFRAEIFNILNHPIYGLVDPTYTDATFGQATRTLNQSLGTVSSLYQQGGNRSMQFALKIKF